MLLERGADLNLKDNDGKTAFDIGILIYTIFH